ncbi:hypothetical protein CJ030_MR5G017341 [Morella rubra]|uniref:Uncharacterized protein n=1 Tax=Morella rubra TaxID=262757 RepID=A0A6A1VR51_9ROSI|nr:hypothetical protein CJ030_MR5G017341 [Morella rubra]
MGLLRSLQYTTSKSSSSLLSTHPKIHMVLVPMRKPFVVKVLISRHITLQGAHTPCGKAEMVIHQS